MRGNRLSPRPIRAVRQRRRWCPTARPTAWPARRFLDRDLPGRSSWGRLIDCAAQNKPRISPVPVNKALISGAADVRARADRRRQRDMNEKAVYLSLYNIIYWIVRGIRG